MIRHGPLKLCMGCRAVRYCSRECQLADRPDHRLQCRLVCSSASRTPATTTGAHSTDRASSSSSTPAAEVKGVRPILCVDSSTDQDANTGASTPRSQRDAPLVTSPPLESPSKRARLHHDRAAMINFPTVPVASANDQRSAAGSTPQAT